jgi:hypothetical protein
LTLDAAYNEALLAAQAFNLRLRVVDRTENTLTLLIEIDVDLAVHIYVNTKKIKLNMALVWQRRRIFGIDREGAVLHIHPFEDPDSHQATVQQFEINKFLSLSMQYLEQAQIL